jgi:hypothetical protein
VSDEMNDEDKIYLWAALMFQLATVIVEPFVVVQLWRWFLVPLGLPALRWLSAFGLNLVVGVLIYRSPGTRTNKQIMESCIAAFFSGVLAFGVGYIALKLGS